MKAEPTGRVCGFGVVADAAQETASTKLRIAFKHQQAAEPASRRAQLSWTPAAAAWVVVGVAIIVALVTLAANDGWELATVEMGSETVGVMIHRTEPSPTP